MSHKELKIIFLLVPMSLQRFVQFDTEQCRGVQMFGINRSEVRRFLHEL